MNCAAHTHTNAQRSPTFNSSETKHKCPSCNLTRTKKAFMRKATRELSFSDHESVVECNECNRDKSETTYKCMSCNLLKNKKAFMRRGTKNFCKVLRHESMVPCNDCNSRRPSGGQLLKENLMRHDRVIRPTTLFYGTTNLKSRQVIQRQHGKERLPPRLTENKSEYAVRRTGQRGKPHCDQTFLVAFPKCTNPSETDLEEYREQVETLGLQFYYERSTHQGSTAWMVVIAGPAIPFIQECITFVKNRTSS